MEDITPYARLDVSHRGTDRGTAWAVLLARVLLGFPLAVVAYWKIVHVGAFVQTRAEFVIPLNSTSLPLWARWLIGFPVPFIDLACGVLVMLGWQTRGALLAVAATTVITGAVVILRDPMQQTLLQLLPRIVLLLFLLVTPEAADRWSLDAWLDRRAGLR